MRGDPLRRLNDPARKVDEELRYHIDRRIQELRSEGLSPAEARRRAEEEFGDVDFTRAYCVAQDRAKARQGALGTVFRSVTHDVHAIARGLLRRPAGIAAPVAVLALGVALNAVVFTVVRSTLLAPLPVTDEDRAWILEELQDGGGLMRASYPVVREWSEHAGSFERLGGYLDGPVPIMAEDRPMHVPAASVTRGFFDLLGDPFVVGTGFTAVNHAVGGELAVVLAEGLWRRAFAARPDIVGAAIRVNGVPHAVTGVLRDAVAFPGGTELWLPLEPTYASLTEIAGAKILVAVGILRPGVTAETASRELAGLSAAVVGGAPEARLTPLRDRVVGDMGRPLLLLQGAVLLVLLAACANAGGILLTRAVRRRGHLAIHAALGAAPLRLAGGTVLEGLGLGLAAGLLGVALAAVLLPPTLAIVPTELPRLGSPALDPTVVSAALLLAAATGTLTSLVPMLMGLGARPANTLRHHIGRSGGSPWLRRFLDGFVVGQMALATVLTLGAGLLVRSFLETVREDPGFDASRVVAVEVSLPGLRYTDDGARLAFARRLLEGGRTLPGASGAALGRNLPVSGSNMTSPLRVEGSEQTDAIQIARVSDAYFDVMGIPIVDGATFAAADREDGSPVLLVDETLRRVAGLSVGSRAHSFFGSAEMRDVVGVTGAVRHAGLRSEPVPVAYEPFFQSGGSSAFTLLIRSSAPAGTVTEAARELVWSLDPELPADRIGTMSDRLSASVAEPRFYTVVMGAFAVLAVLLALAGCQAGLAHRVAARQRELGLRMALGATTSGVRAMIVRRGLTLTVAGALLGLAVAVPASGLLRSQLYGVSPLDPLTYGVLLAALLTGAAVTADVPARRAAAMDPARTLRED